MQLESLNKGLSPLNYFVNRKRVLFLSYCRFWERHPFVQQSLARHLTQQGVEVTWLDGEGWRPYQPVCYWNSKGLSVRQLGRLPGTRWNPVQRLSQKWQQKQLEAYLQGEPVVWVQGGIERLGRIKPLFASKP